ncbi:cytochrome P450 [Nocardia africana]|uniref:Cytochrome P450 n=1 Tax=Nocardia africana TaxID=134964 RepID=A0ABW6NRN9_9NOCA
MVSQLMPLAEQVVDDLVDAAIRRGRFDILEDLAVPLAVAMIPVWMLGADPADAHRFREWQLAIARGTDPDSLLAEDAITAREAAAAACMGHFAELADRKKRAPGPDLLSELVTTGVTEKLVTEAQAVGIALLLLVAGMETSINLIGNGTLALLRNPEQLQILQERPNLIRPALDEMLRYDAPTQFTIRVALADTVVGGRTFRRGEGVVVMTASASRDERAFPDADTFDVTRYAGSRPTRRHLGFSVGIHYCFGAPLARIEGTIALRTLLARAPGLRLDADTIEYRPSLIHRSVAALPVTV